MQAFLQTLQVYDNERGNKPSYFVTEEDCKFFLQQAKILQDRAAYIRQEWARLEALQATQSALPTPPAQQSTQSITQQATQPITQQEEEPLQQANAENTAEKIAENTVENTAEKPSGSKAPITKNTGLLSTLPCRIATQQTENTTAIWPVIPTALIWYITAMTSQEEDLLRRSQPIGPSTGGSSDDTYLDELKPSDVLLQHPFHYSKAFTAAGDFAGCTPLISLASPFISGIRRIMHAYFLP
ncbi:hypothetical protein HO133_009966 [Letharia lupina]|uniref:Uncharacterized protein n=1 Tax=Letharia lupina TaxID=560253 RepID=A0A8H6CJW8_9LECA|nr:uncharacterized protein HO133_009966 [Letharia lupina]KAF6224772.1 hypothetical protein HO133_009966 [Letharia lupina]